MADISMVPRATMVRLVIIRVFVKALGKNIILEISQAVGIGL